MRFSWFSGFYSNKPQQCDLPNWKSFVKVMRDISEVKGKKPESKSDKEQGLISSAIYKSESNRANENVLGWEMVLLDIDDGVQSLTEIQNHFSGYNSIIYSSPSCTHDKLKLRVCMPLSEFADSSVVSQIWHGCNIWCDGIVDAQTKDKSRLYYVPARYTNKSDYRHIFIVNKGKDLDWKDLIQKYPSPKESDRFKEVNKLSGLKRKIYLKTNKQPTLDIQSKDCPFVYKKMIEDYLLTPAGQHHKAIYRFMVLCCYNAQKIDYPLSIDELVQMGSELDSMDGGYYPEKKLYDSAKDAISYTGI
jgi:hypothetical protein